MTTPRFVAERTPGGTPSSPRWSADRAADGHRIRRQARPRMGPPGAPFPTSKYGPADGLGVLRKAAVRPVRLPQTAIIRYVDDYLRAAGIPRSRSRATSSMILSSSSLRCRPVG